MNLRRATLLAWFCGMTTLMVCSVNGQDLRAEKTFFVKPRLGLAHYHGDRTENLTFAFDKQVPFSGGLELGYQLTPALAFSIQPNVGRFAALSPYFDGADRSFLQVMARYTAGARSARIAPFVQAGVQGAGGSDAVAIGPAAGFGFDVALTDRLYLLVEAMTSFSMPDDAFDADDSESPGFDFVGYVGPGLKYNFKSAFTPVDVQSLDCPSDAIAGESVTFSAATNGAAATPPVTYAWNWGDGASAAGSVATHVFDRAGTYTVSFTAANNGHADTETCAVDVSPLPVPPEIVRLTASETSFEVCEPVTVDFDADIVGDAPLTYQWDFGDGTTAAGEDATHAYANPGTYTATLTVSNRHGESTRSISITGMSCTAGICLDVSDMNSVFFGRNSSTPTEDAFAALEENVEIFEQCPNLCARIEGVAAPAERNPSQLSEDRARAVEQYYIERGIATSRFVTVGRGEVGAETSTKDGTAQFRRVDTLPGQCEDVN